METDIDSIDDFFAKYELIRDIHNYKNTPGDAKIFLQKFDFIRPLTNDNKIIIMEGIRQAIINGKYYILNFLIFNFNIQMEKLGNKPDLLMCALNCCAKENTIYDLTIRNINVTTDEYIEVINVLISHNYPVSSDHIAYAKSRCNNFLLLLSCCFPIGTWTRIFFLLRTNI